MGEQQVNPYEKVMVKPFDLHYFIESNKFGTDDIYYFKLRELSNLDANYIEHLFVKDEFKGQGYGKQYVNQVKAEGKPIVLYSEFDAVEFWISQGFKEWNGSEFIFTWGLDLEESKREIIKLKFADVMVGVRIQTMGKYFIDVDNEGLERIGLLPSLMKIQRYSILHDYDGVLMSRIEQRGRITVEDYSDIIENDIELRDFLLTTFHYAVR